MFWRFNYMPSRVDSLLDKENITLQELMDEDDVVQECKSQNKKLVDFLVKPETMELLVHMVVDNPADDIDDKARYRYPNIACDLITSDVSQITDALVTSESLMNVVYSFLDTDDDLNPLQASFFSKLMGLLITRKSEMTVAFLKAQDSFIDRLLRHIGVSAIMDLLLRLITCIESNECRNNCITVVQVSLYNYTCRHWVSTRCADVPADPLISLWLSEKRLVSRLVGLIDPSETAEKHTNAAQSLCDIIRLSRDRDHMSQLQDLSGSDTLLKAIEMKDSVTEILDHMLNGERVESVIVNGLCIIQTLLECRKISPDGLQEPMSLMDPDNLTPGVANVIEALIPRLKDFHDILLNPPQQYYRPMPTSVGVLSVPLGQTRLQIARLIAMLIMTNVEPIMTELISLGTVPVLLDLFFQYMWNNFLHASVEQCITGILSSSLPNNVLQNQLFGEFRLLERIAEAFEDSNSQKSDPCRPRRGYMGHMTRIANQLVSRSANDASLLNDLPEEVRDRWNSCVSNSLLEINKLNTTELVGGSVGLASSSDDDDEFRSISFPQDDAMQKAFVEYQQQKMTTDFVEQFGFNEDEFAEQEECIGSPFNERISGISFELSSVEDSPTAAAMFEHACSDRIRQFDSTDSDEELWDDKEPSFSNLPDNRHSSVIQRSQNTTATNLTVSEGEDYEGERSTDGSDASDDSDPELQSPRYIRQSNISDQDNSDVPFVDQQPPKPEVEVGCPLNHHDSESSTTERMEDDNALYDTVAINGNEVVNVDTITLDITSSLHNKDNELNIDELQVDGITKMDTMRLPCLLDTCSSNVGGSDSLALSSVHNGPV